MKRFTRLERAERAESLAKNRAPFIHLPGNPPEHKVLKEFPDGVKLRVSDVEMIYNDALLIDAAGGIGLYVENLDYPPYQRAAYELAMEMYAGVELPEIWKRALREAASGEVV